MIELLSISKDYILKRTKSRILDNISLSFPRSGMYFLLGQSGSGKTTLLNILGGIFPPSNGSVLINGTDTASLSDKDREVLRLNFFSFVFQENNLVPELTVRENIFLPQKISGRHDVSNFDSVVHRCGIELLLDRSPSTISTGQKQRVCIARALLNATPVILADEPTGSLDYKNTKEIFQLFKEISRDTLVIIATHDRKSAFRFGDAVYEIDHGKVDSGKPSNESNGSLPIREKRKTPFSFLLGLSFRGLKQKWPFFASALIASTLITSLLSPLFSYYFADRTEGYLETLYESNIHHIQFDSPSLATNLNEERIAPLLIQKGFVQRIFTYDEKIVDMNRPVGNLVNHLSGIALYDDTIAEQYPLIAGSLPEEGKHQVLITKLTFDTLAAFGFLDGTRVENYTDALGKTLPSGEISGIIDTFAQKDETVANSHHNLYYIPPASIPSFLSDPFFVVYQINTGADTYPNYCEPLMTDPNLSSGILLSARTDSQGIIFREDFSLEDGYILGVQSYSAEARQNASQAIDDFIASVWSPEIATALGEALGISNPTPLNYRSYLLSEPYENVINPGKTYAYFLSAANETLFATFPTAATLLIRPSGSDFFKKEEVPIVGYDLDGSDQTYTSTPHHLFQTYVSAKGGIAENLIYRLSFDRKSDLATIKTVLAVSIPYYHQNENDGVYHLVESPLVTEDQSAHGNVAAAYQLNQRYHFGILAMLASLLVFTIILLIALYLLEITSSHDRNSILLSLGLSKKDLGKIYGLQTGFIGLLSGLLSLIVSVGMIAVTNQISLGLSNVALFQWNIFSSLLAIGLILFCQIVSVSIVFSKYRKVNLSDLVKRDV